MFSQCRADPVIRQWPPTNKCDQDLIQDFVLPDDDFADLSENAIAYDVKSLHALLQIVRAPGRLQLWWLIRFDYPG